MNENYMMQRGDVFVAEECGCTITVLEGPRDLTMALTPPRCCCGNEMVKDYSFLRTLNLVDFPEEPSYAALLPGMLE